MLWHLCFLAYGLASALPAAFWAVQGLAGAFLGRRPGFGPEAAFFAEALCLLQALAWLWLPCPGGPDEGPDGLLEDPPAKTKALLPDEWRGELCSSIVSNQS